jgi:hypothetical protein
LAQDEADLDNPATLDANPVAAIPDTKYNKLVLELGTSLDRPATAHLGRPALSLSDIKALHTSLCSQTFHTGSVLIYEPPGLFNFRA